MRSDDEDSADEDERPRRQYSAPRDWNRMDWERRVAFLKPHEFKRFYRFDYKLFKTVVMKLRPILEKHSPSATKLRGSAISAEIQLACALRYLAGGSYLDIAHQHGVSDTNFDKVVGRVVGALLHVYGAEHLGIDKPRSLSCQRSLLEPAQREAARAAPAHPDQENDCAT